jgi:hypothetical protein
MEQSDQTQGAIGVIELFDLTLFDCERLVSVFACYSETSAVCLIVDGVERPSGTLIRAVERSIKGITDWEARRLEEVCGSRKRFRAV